MEELVEAGIVASLKGIDDQLGCPVPKQSSKIQLYIR